MVDSLCEPFPQVGLSRRRRAWLGTALRGAWRFVDRVGDCEVICEDVRKQSGDDQSRFILSNTQK
jgi:hypothetical protein